MEESKAVAVRRLRPSAATILRRLKNVERFNRHVAPPLHHELKRVLVNPIVEKKPTRASIHRGRQISASRNPLAEQKKIRHGNIACYEWPLAESLPPTSSQELEDGPGNPTHIFCDAFAHFCPLAVRANSFDPADHPPQTPFRKPWLMHRRSPYASFSLAFRRFDFLLLAAGLCCAVALLPSRTARAANTDDNVLTTGGTDLSSGATYSGGVPFFTSDATFTNSIYPATTFDTNGASLNFGTLDDLDATQAIVITDSSTVATISLNTAANATSGSAATDLIYLASGANLTIQGGSASPLTISLAANGNFDIAGTASANIGAVISGSTATIGFNKTGTGTLILSGLNTYTGLTTVSAGTLRLGVANAINTANSLTTSGTGIFDLGGFNQTLGNIGANQSFAVLTNGGTITNSSSTEATLTIIDRTFASA